MRVSERKSPASEGSEYRSISERIREAPKSKNIEEVLKEISRRICLQADIEEEAMRYLEKIH